MAPAASLEAWAPLVAVESTATGAWRASRARAGCAPRILRARSQALAGALLALLSWWLRNGTPGSPEHQDELFHALVRGGAGAPVPLAAHGPSALRG